MRIASWNINSVRIRTHHIDRFVKQEKPDVICLQETKVMDEQFPLDEFKKMGFEHFAIRGEKSYNGVAIISKFPLLSIERHDIAGSKDTRHISAILPGDIELHNFYIPAGGDEPDVDVNPKYKFKLDFVDYMNDWFAKERQPSDKVVILGDFNIAPGEHDVWSSKQLRNTVSHTQPERVRLDELRENLGWIDTARHFIPDEEKSYSWWSYRNRDRHKANRGRRLDHIWTTPALKDSLQGYSILDEARDWERPSDHVPIMLDVRDYSKY